MTPRNFREKHAHDYQLPEPLYTNHVHCYNTYKVVCFMHVHIHDISGLMNYSSISSLWHLSQPLVKTYELPSMVVGDLWNVSFFSMEQLSLCGEMQP